jgi:glycosyltransferase involved in cell wall biosynthesis
MLMSRDGGQRPEVSVVVPVYRNAETLKELHRRVHQVLGNLSLSCEMIFVDDACPAGSLSVLEQIVKTDPSSAVLSLERNEGPHKAVFIGLAYARGKYVVVIDADLQDPPEAIPLLLAELRAGFSAAFGGRRGDYESAFRLLSSRLFKATLGSLCGLPPGAGLFVAMDLPMVKRLLAIGEPNPSLVVMMAFAGLPLVSVPVTRSKRAAGRSAYTSWARFKYGVLTVAQALRWRAGSKQNVSSSKVHIKAYIGARFIQTPPETEGIHSQ